MKKYAETSGPNKGRVDVEDFREMARETGIIPRVLKEMPVLSKDYYHYFNAWDFLRGVTNEGRISLTDMRHYLSINPFFDSNEFVEIINAIDLAVGC